MNPNFIYLKSYPSHAMITNVNPVHMIYVWMNLLFTFALLELQLQYEIQTIHHNRELLKICLIKFWMIATPVYWNVKT